tara:strand:- start:7918 stop:9861 length:1944 start_codon:yes stop_codon:yes gene_type:complete
MALEFSQEFEQSLSSTQGVRSDKIANTPLKTLIEASTRKDKKAMVEVLTEGGLANNTLREINENAEIKEKFGRFFEQQGKNKKTAAKADKVIGSFQPFFQEAGYLGPKGNNPARILLSNVIGTKATQELFSTETIRKVPSPYPFDTYTKLKGVVTGLLNSEDKATRLAGVQLAMHVIGGYRPSDFKNLKVENINFTSGVVSDLLIKDRGKTTTKQGYFPKIIRDILLKEVNPEGQGLVFPTNNETVINNALKKANIPTEYTTAGKVKQGVFTLEDTRKLNETHLTSLGYDEKNPIRLAATLRASKTTIGQYVATGAGGRDIEELFVKTSSPHVAFTGTSNHAQYLSDIGVKPSDIVKRYKVTNNVIDRFPLDRVAEFQEKYPTAAYEGGDKVISSTLSEVNEGNSKLYQDTVTTKLQTEKDIADIKYAETAKIAEEKRIETQNVKKKVQLEKKATDLVELKNKGANALDWIYKNLGKPIKKLAIGAIGFETARQLFTDPAAFARDVAVDVVTGTNPYKIAADMAVRSVSPAGEGADFIRGSERNQAGQLIPSQQMGLESETRSVQDQEALLQNMQNVVGADTNIQTDQPENTNKAQALNVIEQDTNVGNKFSTFGRQPNVSAGFVTPPSRSDLLNETERQQNFLGVT